MAPSFTRVGFLISRRATDASPIQPGFTPVINSVMW